MSNNLLAGKRGVVFGALNEQSIAWKVAEKCVSEGATIVLTNAPVAMRMGERKIRSARRAMAELADAAGSPQLMD